MIAVDTNILVYARRREFPQHGRATKALTALAEGDGAWSLPLFCIGEFVRVVTHHRLFQPPTKPGEAVAFVEALLESPSVRLLTPGLAFRHVFADLVRATRATGNLVFDAQIAALCLEYGVREILTEDRDFRHFEGLKAVSLSEWAEG